MPHNLFRCIVLDAFELHSQDCIAIAVFQTTDHLTEWSLLVTEHFHLFQLLNLESVKVLLAIEVVYFDSFNTIPLLVF